MKFDRYPQNILLTGLPGCGKTTLVESLIHPRHPSFRGFFTRESREKGRRVGFAIITLEGRQGILAHEKSRNRPRWGKYGVHLEELERLAVPSMNPSQPDEIVIIDEIGKMECLSPLFREALVRVLNSSNRVVATIAMKGTPFIEEVKSRPDVVLLQVSEANRSSLAESLHRFLHQEHL
jgi:nucleoside-triphosphatase THEP1